MLNKANRINKTRDLQKVYRLGKASHTSALVIKFVAQEKKRLAFVVSKKVSKKAVERNRIKRILREFLRQHIEYLASGDYMVIVKPQAKGLSAAALRDNLEKGLIKANLWRK